MTPESQNVEWKSSWRDEYLKWICGFANAQGGVLEIGRNDCGEVVGVSDVDRLLEEIPNKVQSLLGIVVEVNLKSESGLEYLEIVVEPHPNPISYRGKFHYRTGSTKQVLEGAALTRLLLQKHGRTWDDVPLPGVDLDSLDGRVLADFRRRGAESERLPPDILGESDESVIEKLQLREAGLLRRAAVLLFHPAPHQFLMEAVVKIGYFRGSELLFQDVVEGDLFTQVKRAMDLLYTKYTRALISYDGLYRVETFPVPREAMREAVINAIIHRDYASATPIQIRVYDDRISMWNAAHLPPGWVTDQLAEELSSRPHNPRVAYAFFRAGMIEAWGRGIRRIVDICHEVGNPTPSWRLEAGGNGVWVRFPFSEAYQEADSAARGLAGDSTTQEATRRSGSARKQPEDNQKTTRKQPERGGSSQNLADRIVSFLRGNPSASRRKIAEALEGTTEGSVRYHLDKLKKSGTLRRVGPDRGGRWMVVDACAGDERTAGEAQPENRQKTTRSDDEPPAHRQKTARKQPEPRSLYDRILTLLRQNPSTSRRKMAAALGTTKSTIRYWLDKLREDGKIARVGPDKGGYWKVLGDSGSEPDPDGESDPGSLS